jgi:tRNA(Arg) A34 adenosine deaminase TadA
VKKPTKRQLRDWWYNAKAVLIICVVLYMVFEVFRSMAAEQNWKMSQRHKPYAHPEMMVIEDAKLLERMVD